MLGRNSYTRDELDRAQKVVDQQVAAYKKLAKAIDATSDPKAKAALDAFEPLFFTSMTLELDRLFVHRIRAVSGKDTNPCTEVELLAESLLAGDELRTNKVIKYVPEQAVAQVAPGDEIKLGAAQFDRLAKAYFAEIAARFAS